MRPILASILMTLTACASSTDVLKPSLPDEPVDLKACVVEAVPVIPGARGTPILKGQTGGIIGDQHSSALMKDKCVKDWQAFYHDLRAGLAGKPDRAPSASLLDRVGGGLGL